MAERSIALVNLERAFAELEGYVALPVTNQRDNAGLIQGFEFTFELFWKTFQKLAPEAGLDASWRNGRLGRRQKESSFV